MHPIKITERELILLKQAKKENDWEMLPTSKLKYLYQRYIALPAGDLGSVRKIVEAARE